MLAENAPSEQIVEEQRLLLVKVATTDGKLWFHRYHFPSEGAERRGLADSMTGKILALEKGKGHLLFENPLAAYNISKIVRLEWMVSGPLMEVAEVEQRIAGLNIDR